MPRVSKAVLVGDRAGFDFDDENSLALRIDHQIKAARHRTLAAAFKLGSGLDFATNVNAFRAQGRPELSLNVKLAFTLRSRDNKLLLDGLNEQNVAHSRLRFQRTALGGAVQANQLHRQPIAGLRSLAGKQFADEALCDANPLRNLRLGHARLSQLGNEVLPVHAPLLQAQSYLAIALAIAFGDS